MPTRCWLLDFRATTREQFPDRSLRRARRLNRRAEFCCRVRAGRRTCRPRHTRSPYQTCSAVHHARARMLWQIWPTKPLRSYRCRSFDSSTGVKLPYLHHDGGDVVQWRCVDPGVDFRSRTIRLSLLFGCLFPHSAAVALLPLAVATRISSSLVWGSAASATDMSASRRRREEKARCASTSIRATQHLRQLRPPRSACEVRENA